MQTMEKRDTLTGKETFMGDVAPGRDFAVDSFQGHMFHVRDMAEPGSGKLIKIHAVVGGKRQTVVFDGNAGDQGRRGHEEL